MLFLSLIVLEHTKKDLFASGIRAQTQNEDPIKSTEFFEYDSRPRETWAFTLELHCEMRARTRVLQIGGAVGRPGVCVREAVPPGGHTSPQGPAAHSSSQNHLKHQGCSTASAPHPRAELSIQGSLRASCRPLLQKEQLRGLGLAQQHAFSLGSV